jgi:hypothetical protein
MGSGSPMARIRNVILFAAAVAALAAAPASAEARTLKAGLPSAGDVTVVHVKFARGVAQLPRFRLVSRSTRGLLRRYRVAVIGGSFRLSRRQVVGSVLLMRKRGPGRVARTPRGARARIEVAARAASVTVERNTIADLRHERARASGEQANAPTACGETGLFTLLSGDTLPASNWSFGLYYNDWDRLIDFSDPGVERSDVAEVLRIFELTHGVACGRTDDFDPDAQLSLDDFIASLGATPPAPACNILTTFVGPATDGEGNILTQPVVNISLRCDSPITGITFGIPDHTPTRCSDSAGHDCTIEDGKAVFPFLLPPFEDRSYGITTDPPLERGDHLDIFLDSPRGDVEDHQVM